MTIQGPNTNFSVIQLYAARELKLYKDAAKTEPVHLDGRGVKVAIVDTGINGLHPQLEGRVTHAYNAATEDAGTAIDENGHGTAVAGVIAAQNEHLGIAPGVDLYAIKVSDRANDRHSNMMRLLTMGVRYAIHREADLIVVPRGSDAGSSGLARRCERAMRQGRLVIASNGNKCYGRKVPAGWSKRRAVGVGSVRITEEDHEEYTAQATAYDEASNAWIHTNLVAPGRDVRVLTLDPTTADYELKNGTSFAAPHVAAALAIGISIARQVGADHLTSNDIEEILERTAFPYTRAEDLTQAEALKTEIDAPDEDLSIATVKKGMFGAGLIQVEDFLRALCADINRDEEKIFIE